MSGCCAGVLFRVLRIMFAIGVLGCCWGCCPGCSGSCLSLGGVRVLSRVLCRGAVQGAPDNVCHWAVLGCCIGVLFRVLRIMFAIEVSGCYWGCCPGWSGLYLPLGGVRVLCRGAVQGAPDHVCHWGVRVLLRVLSRVLRIMFAIGRCQGAVQGAVQGCCSGCSGSCLPLGGIRVLCRGAVQGAPDHVCHWAVLGCCIGVLFRVLRIMFAIEVSGCYWGCCPGCSGLYLPLGGVRVLCRGAVQGAPDHVCHWGVRVLLRVLSRVLRIMFAIGRCQGAVQGAVQGCCSGCSGSCLPLGGVSPGCCHWGVLSRVLRIMFAIEVSGCYWGCCPGCSGLYLPLGGVRVLCRGAVQGAPDHVCHWGVRVLLRVLSRVLRIMFAIGRCQGAVQGAVQGCCSGCSG